MITQKELKEMLHYNLETGIFTWANKRASWINIGDVAGHLTVTGYITIRVIYKSYLAHRLAWLYVHGEWPENLIDHINNNRSDNRICNLRKATKTENNRNTLRGLKNKSGVKSVFWKENAKKWQVQMKINGIQKHFGYFKDIEFAELVAQEIRSKYHGEFARDK
jgi:hypothetical protein